MTEIYSVGPTVCVHGELQVPGRLTVDGDRFAGTLRLDERGPSVELQVQHDGLDHDGAVEALRIGARIAQKRWPDRALAIVDPPHGSADGLVDDGFAPTADGTYARLPGPIPLTGERTRRSYDVYVHPLDVHWNFVPAETDVFPSLKGAPASDVLDLGCGYGKNARVIERWGHRVVGIDASDIAIERAAALHPAGTYVTASALELPFDDASFDVVIDVGCLHCIPADVRQVAADEARQVLRPGGKLLSRMFLPRTDDWVRRQPFVADAFGLSRGEVHGLLARAGFVDVTVEQRDFASFVEAVAP